MRDDDLYAFGNSLGIPGLPLDRGNGRAQYGSADPRPLENFVDPGRHVMLLCVHREDMAQTPFRQFRFDHLDQLSLFRVQAVLRQVLWHRNDELLPLLVLFSTPFPPDGAYSERM